MLNLLLVLLKGTISTAEFSPCEGKSMLNGDCDLDSDCEIKGSVCLRQKCKCHPNYMEMSEKNNVRRCIKMPAKIGQDCQNKCREPLFCRNGKCQCVQRGTTSVVNGECIWVSKVGDRCTKHTDCTSPFSACVNQQCSCISGTFQQGTKCVASTNCPLGGTPSGSCIRRASPQQISNFVEQADTCPQGYFCVTALESPLGFCCPVHCPLGTTPDYNYSCIPGLWNSNDAGETKPAAISPAAAAAGLVFGKDSASSSSGLNNFTRLLNTLIRNTHPCPSETHYCHYISGDTFSQAVCCKRPCNSMSPYSLFLNNQCVARGQLNAECKSHEQCGAGEGQKCKNGTCQCLPGFVPATDQVTHPIKNPSQMCIRECEKGLNRDTSCLMKTELLGPCFIQEQCPENSGCWRGKCLCRCGYRKTIQKKCVLIPPSSTQQPPSEPAESLIVTGQGGDIVRSLIEIFGPRTNG